MITFVKKHIETRAEILNIWNIILEEKKSDLARRRILKKNIILCEENLADLRAAIKCPYNQRYLHGDHINGIDILNAKRELEIIKELFTEYVVKSKNLKK